MSAFSTVIPSFFKRKLVGDALALYLVQGLNYLVPLLLIPYVLRALGAEGYGTIAFAQSVMGYGVVATDFGFMLTAARDIAVARQDRIAVARVFWATMAAKVLLLGASLGLVALAVAAIPALRDHWQVCAAVAVSVLGNVLFPQWYLQGMERLRDAALIQAVSKVLYAATTVLLVHSPDDLLAAALIMSSQQLLAVAVAGVLRKELYPKLYSPPRWVEVRGALASGWPMFIANASTTLYGNTNTFVLGLLSGERAVAYYNLGLRIVVTLQSLAAPLTSAVFPRASVLFARREPEGWRLVRQVAWILLPGLALLSIILMLIAPQIVTWMGGASFVAATSVLRWLAPFPLLVTLGTLLAHCVMVNLNLTARLAPIYATAGFLNLLLLPPLVLTWSADGAAASLLIAETLVDVLMLRVLLRRTRQTS